MRGGEGKGLVWKGGMGMRGKCWDLFSLYFSLKAVLLFISEIFNKYCSYFENFPLHTHTYLFFLKIIYARSYKT